MTLAYQRIEDLITEMFGPEADRAKLHIFATVIMAASSLDNKPPRGGCGKENAETSYGYQEMTGPK